MPCFFSDLIYPEENRTDGTNKANLTNVTIFQSRKMSQRQRFANWKNVVGWPEQAYSISRPMSSLSSIKFETYAKRKSERDIEKDVQKHDIACIYLIYTKVASAAAITSNNPAAISAAKLAWRRLVSSKASVFKTGNVQSEACY